MVVVRGYSCDQLCSWPRGRHQGEYFPSSLGLHCLITPRNLHCAFGEHTKIQSLLKERSI